MKITFPNKTAKEIVDECHNKLGSDKLLYNPKGWYEKEDFYTKERCRQGTKEVSYSIEHYNKSWNECNLMGEENMLNFAEYIWFIKTYLEETGKYPEENEYKWSWTSSRSSYGRLVYVGCCGGDGVYVYDDEPDYSDSRLGVRFFRSEKIKLGQSEAFESRLEKIESWIRKEANFINPFN